LSILVTLPHSKQYDHLECFNLITLTDEHMPSYAIHFEER